MLKAVIALGLILLASTALSQHRHELYDADCCQITECRPITCNELKTQVNGSVQYQGKIAQNVRPSKDKSCHVCATDAMVYCVYIGAPEG